MAWVACELERDERRGAADQLGEPTQVLHQAHHHLGRIPQRTMGRQQIPCSKYLVYLDFHAVDF